MKEKETKENKSKQMEKKKKMKEEGGQRRRRRIRRRQGAGIAQLVVLGLAVHSVVGSILLWEHFPVEGIFPLELTWVQTPFPLKLLRMRV